MQNAKVTLFVLGSSLTSLSIIRDAARNKIQCILIDNEYGIASTSSSARFYFVDPARDKVFELLDNLCVARENFSLIATSDSWLKYLIKNRGKLEKYFGKILHAKSEVLETCLDKRRFSDWCIRNNVNTPYLYTGNDTSLNYLQREIQEKNKKIFLRPINSSSAQKLDIPKALEVRDVTSLEKWLGYFEINNVPFVATESLLSENLIQYSIPFVRTEDEFTCLTAIKARPEANDCAVGTYVYLKQAPDLEKLAYEITNKLDYWGMGEIEVLYSALSNKYYLIEINARPWLQYELAVRAGCNYLSALVLNCRIADNISKDNIYWLNFVDDFYICFSKSEGYFWSRKISLYRYFQSLWRANAHPVYSLWDLKPLLYNLRSFFRLFTK